MTPPRASSALRRALDESHRQAARLQVEGFPEPLFRALQNFQRSRLARTYDDLARRPHTAPAVTFFLEQLYGDRGGTARDRQLEGALPIMERTLPAGVKRTLADAFRLQALSLELDIELALAHAGKGLESVDALSYASLYPVIPRGRREQQIALIHGLALELDRVVRLPLVGTLIRAMRTPAQAMGFGDLQSFLERGLEAFRSLPDARAFADTVRDRETRIMERLYEGAPDPFDMPGDAAP